MANPFSYEGKRVVLTGAYSGVGAALLELLDELGAEHITVIDLKEPSGPASQFVQADLSSQARSTPPSPPSRDPSTRCSTTPVWRARCR